MQRVVSLPLITLGVHALIGCDMQPSANERAKQLEALAYKQNHQHNDERALELIDEALRLCPDKSSLIESRIAFLWNVCAGGEIDRFTDYCQDCLEKGLGEQILIRVYKAQAHVDGGIAWEDTVPTIKDRDQCVAAVDELAKVQQLTGDVEAAAEEYDLIPMGWDEHFGCLRSLPEYKVLFGNK